MLLTPETLKKICPAAPAHLVPVIVDSFNKDADKYGVNTPTRIAHFIAQVAHESGSFRYSKEIATGEAYEGRKDLGNVNKGDGKKFKGRGWIQTTGRINYKQASKDIFGDERLLEHPEILEQPEYAMLSAFWYWNTRRMNVIADKTDDHRIKVVFQKSKKEVWYSPVEYITYRINGGQNGIAERKVYYARAKQVLGI
jgi:putative chitinase